MGVEGGEGEGGGGRARMLNPVEDGIQQAAQLARYMPAFTLFFSLFHYNAYTFMGI